MGDNYQKVKNSALSGFGREMGRNAGKALSNYLFGDSHATPVKILRDQERAKIMKFKAQAEEKKLQGKKELLELKHQQELEIIAQKERIKQEKLEQQEEERRLEEFRIEENKNKVIEFEDYINSITNLQKAPYESINWKEITNRDFKPNIVITKTLKSTIQYVRESVSSIDLELALELADIEIDDDYDDKFSNILSIILNKTDSADDFTLNQFNSLFDDEKLFYSVFDRFNITKSSQFKEYCSVFELDSNEAIISLSGIDSLENKTFEGLYDDEGQIFGFDENAPEKTILILETLEKHHLSDFSLVPYSVSMDLISETTKSLDELRKGASFKEKIFGLSQETKDDLRTLHRLIENELRPLRGTLISFYNYIVELRKYIRSDDLKREIENYKETYSDYFKLEKELKIYALKVVENNSGVLDNNSLVKYLLEAESGIIDYFSNISEIAPETSFAFENDILNIEIIIEDSEDIIPIQHPKLIRGKELKYEDINMKTKNDWFQDYVCGLSLRVSSEMFSVLPFLKQTETIIFTSVLNSSTGNYENKPILNVCIDAKTLQTLNFENLDASDCVENIFNASMNWSSKNGFLEISIQDNVIIKQERIPEETVIKQSNIEELDNELESIVNEIEEFSYLIPPQITNKI